MLYTRRSRVELICIDFPEVPCETETRIRERFGFLIPYLTVVERTEMYKVKPFYDADVAISTPTNMYKIQNLHQAEKGVSIMVRDQKTLHVVHDVHRFGKKK